MATASDVKFEAVAGGELGRIEPGQQQLVTVSACTFGNSVGTHDRFIWIIQSSPTSSAPLIIPITIEATASRFLSADVTELDFGKVPGGSKIFYLTNRGSEDVILNRLSLPGRPFWSSARAPSPYYDHVVQWPLTLARGRSIQIYCSFTADQAGLVEDFIEVESDASNAPLLRIPVKADGAMRASLTATPAQIEVDLDQNETVTRIVSLHNSGDLAANWWAASIPSAAAPSWVDWLDSPLPSVKSGTLAGATDEEIPFVFHAGDKAPGRYESSIILSAERVYFSYMLPVEKLPDIVIPYVINVLPRPRLTLAVPEVRFPTLVQGQSSTRTLALRNTGNTALEISEIRLPDASLSHGVILPLIVPPSGDVSIPITFAPTSAGDASGTAHLISNAFEASDVPFDVSAVGLGQGQATTDHTRLVMTAPEGGRATADLGLSAADGSVVWKFMPVSTRSADDPELDQVLASLRQNVLLLDAALPHRYKFSAGGAGTAAITDAALYRSGGGNRLAVTVAGPSGSTTSTTEDLLFTDWAVAERSGTKYFTWQIPGMFGCVTDLPGAGSFVIRSEAGGATAVESGLYYPEPPRIALTCSGRNFTATVRRMLGQTHSAHEIVLYETAAAPLTAEDPEFFKDAHAPNAVAQSVIYGGSITLSSEFDTSRTIFRVLPRRTDVTYYTGLTGSGNTQPNYMNTWTLPRSQPMRLHEIVVAKQGTAAFSSDDLQQLLAIYLPTVSTRATWLTVQPTAGIVPAGGRTQIEVSADAAILKAGDHEGALILARQAAAPVTVPVTFQVTESQRLLTDKTALEFPHTKVPDHSDLAIELHNPGSLPVVLQSASFSDPSFVLTASLPSAINPGESIQCTVRYQPLASGDHVGVLTLVSDASDHPQVTISLSGSAENPAHPVFDPGPRFTWEPLVGPLVTKTITLRNPGDAVLEWSFNQNVVAGISVSPVDGALQPGDSAELTFSYNNSVVAYEKTFTAAFPFVCNGYNAPPNVTVEMHVRPMLFWIAGNSTLPLYRAGSVPHDSQELRLPTGIPDQPYLIGLPDASQVANVPIKITCDADWLTVPADVVSGSSVPVVVSVAKAGIGTSYATLRFASELGEFVQKVKLVVTPPAIRGLVTDCANDVVYAWVTDAVTPGASDTTRWARNFLATIDPQTLQATHTLPITRDDFPASARISNGGIVFAGKSLSATDLSVLPDTTTVPYSPFGMMRDGTILACERDAANRQTIFTVSADLSVKGAAVILDANSQVRKILTSSKEDCAWVVVEPSWGKLAILRIANLSTRAKVVERTPAWVGRFSATGNGASDFVGLSADERWLVFNDKRYEAKNLRKRPTQIPRVIAVAEESNVACAATQVFDLDSLETIDWIPSASQATFLRDDTLITLDSGSGRLRRHQLARVALLMGDSANAPRYGAGQSVSLSRLPVGTVTERVWTLRNLGASTLGPIRFTVDGPDAAVIVVAGPVDLAARSSARVTVRITPAAAGHHEAVIHVASNDLANGVMDIPLTFDVDGESIAPSLPVASGEIIEVGSGHSLAPSISGTMPMTAAWFKDGKAIRNATGSTLQVQAAKLTDAGLYRLDLKNQAGAASVTVPVIVKRQIDQVHDVVEATGATLGSEVKGPVGSYQWLKDGEVVANSTAISGATTGTLRLKHVAQDSTGLYELVIKVGELSAVIARHEVRITKKPIVTTPAMGPWVVGQSVAVLLGSEPAATSYKATGLPPGLKLDVATGSLGGIPSKAGTYTISVTAISAAGAGPARLYRVVVDALEPRLIGSFEGLQDRGYWGNDSLGGAVSISVNASASYSGVLRQGSVRIPFVGQLQAADRSADYVSTTSYKISGGVVDGSLRLDRANGAFSGWLRTGGGPAFTAIRNVTAAEVQKLNFVFDPTPEEVAFGGIPWGNSILSANVDRSGLVKGAGALADGSSVTFASRLAEGGKLPIYLSVKSSTSLQGWLSSTAGQYSGTADWFRLPDQTGKAFSSGIGLHSLNSLGGQYQSPASGTDLFGDVAPANGYRIQLQGEVFSLQLPLNISLKGKGVFVNQPQSKFAFQPATGRFDASCQVLLDGVLQPAKIVGVVLPGQPLGTGWCLIPDGKGGAKSALVILEPLP